VPQFTINLGHSLRQKGTGDLSLQILQGCSGRDNKGSSKELREKSDFPASSDEALRLTYCAGSSDLRQRNFVDFAGRQGVDKGGDAPKW